MNTKVISTLRYTVDGEEHLLNYFFDGTAWRTAWQLKELDVSLDWYVTASLKEMHEDAKEITYNQEDFEVLEKAVTAILHKEQ